MPREPYPKKLQALSAQSTQAPSLPRKQKQIHSCPPHPTSLCQMLLEMVTAALSALRDMGEGEGEHTMSLKMNW